MLTASIAATTVLALAIGVTRVLERRAPPLGDRLAVVERVDGRTPVRQFDVVHAGQWVETSADSRVALRFDTATSLRLDRSSRVRLVSARVIELASGAVYVDTADTDAGFEVRTSIATARDVGTQFEVRLIDASLRLRVRTGMVQLMDGARTVSGHPGTEISLSKTDAVSRPIAVYGAEWEWTTALSPPLHMEGLSLKSFLEQVASEQGWTIEYGDPTLARDAEGIILHGSTIGLAAHDAVAAAIATSGLKYRLEAGMLVVERSGGRKADQ